MINQYGCFIPDLATIFKRQKRSKWTWSTACESVNVLINYKAELPLRLACDASPCEVGAVLSHFMPDAEEKPIAFASRMLRNVEQNYVQIEMEALAIVFGICKFDQYLYGNKVTLLTDHCPLTSHLSSLKSIPSMAAGRMQRWALLLSAHNYTSECRKGELNTNVDGLSRLPLPHSHEGKTDQVDLFYTSQLETLQMSSTEIRRDTIMCYGDGHNW